MNSMRVAAVLMACLALSARAEKSPPDAVVELTAALTEVAATQRAKECFQKTKFMLFGLESKSKGIGIETYIAQGVSKPGTETHTLLERGYGLSGVLDPQVNQYFDACVDKAQ